MLVDRTLSLSLSLSLSRSLVAMYGPLTRRRRCCPFHKEEEEEEERQGSSSLSRNIQQMARSIRYEVLYRDLHTTVPVLTLKASFRRPYICLTVFAQQRQRQQ